MIGEAPYTGGGSQAGAIHRATTYANSRGESAEASGVSFYRNRYYDQNSGRWTQEDPIGIGGGVNLYANVGNNPAAYIDPFGLCPTEAGGDGKTETHSDCPAGSEGFRDYLSSMGTIDRASQRVARSALKPTACIDPFRPWMCERIESAIDQVAKNTYSDNNYSCAEVGRRLRERWENGQFRLVVGFIHDNNKIYVAHAADEGVMEVSTRAFSNTYVLATLLAHEEGHFMFPKDRLEIMAGLVGNHCGGGPARP